MRYDVVILGGSVSGQMMAKRLEMVFPEMSVLIIDKKDPRIHPFHLHRAIDLPGLDKIKPVKMRVGVYDGKEFKNQPTLLDINRYAGKVFGYLQVTNINNVQDQMIYPVTKEELISALKNKYVVLEEEVKRIHLKEKFIGSIGEPGISYRYLINTISLPKFLELASFEHDISFKFTPLNTTMVPMRNTELYHMIYNTDGFCSTTRTTLLNNSLFIETCDDQFGEKDEEYLKALYGVSINEVPSLGKIYPGRIDPIPQQQRKPLFHYLTEKFNIFVLGRYGAWTYKVASDIWEDTLQIVDWIYAKEQSFKFSGRNQT